MKRLLRRMSQSAGFLLACCMFQHCANMQPPTGGPRDLAPPHVIATEPKNGSVNIQPKTITLEFDKYVDKRTVQDALFISPALHGKPKFDWSGTTLEITLPDSLRKNTTYNFSFGTDVADLREHVHFSQPFNFTFSTGPYLDTAIITGVAYCKEPAGTFIFAYSLAQRNPDTLNPTHTKPDYLAAVGKDSTYIIPALPDGMFRLVAVHDEQRNMVYDVGTDGYAAAMTSADIDSNHRILHNVNFNLARPEDTIAPQIVAVSELFSNKILATTSEPLDSTSILPARFAIVDSATSHPLPVRSAVPSSKKIGVEIYTDSMPPNTTYIVNGDSLRDRAGNIMKRDTLRFVSFAKSDTLPPLMTYPFHDSTMDVDDSVLRFSADKPLHKKLTQDGIYLFDSTRKSLPLQFSWLNDAALVARPDTFMSNAWYTLVLEQQKFEDIYGKHGKDSVIRIRFRTFDERNKGTIRGVINDSGNASNAPYVITMTNGKTKASMQFTLQGRGPFTLPHIPDGTYTIEAFRDDHHTGKYYSGKVFPYTFAEPYFLYPQPVRVRARWTVEGVTISF